MCVSRRGDPHCVDVDVSYRRRRSLRARTQPSLHSETKSVSVAVAAELWVTGTECVSPPLGVDELLLHLREPRGLQPRPAMHVEQLPSVLDVRDGLTEPNAPRPGFDVWIIG